jgi:hypothetical protein
LFLCERALQATKPPNPAYKGTHETSMNQNKLWKTDLKEQGIGALTNWDKRCIRTTTEHNILKKLKIRSKQDITYRREHEKMKLLTASPLLMWFAALRIQKLLVAQAVEIE